MARPLALALMAITGLVAVVPAQTIQGRPRTITDGPPIGNRVASLVVFDTLRNQLVVYGGQMAGPPGSNAIDPDPRTYAWNGTEWRVLATSGPTSRDEMAYGVNPVDGSILMVGGRGNAPSNGGPPQRRDFRETWRFDGARWTLVDTLGPEGRAGIQGAWDVERKRFVVFGGVIGNTQPRNFPLETWEWDGSRWTRHAVPAPPGRTGHVMAYDPAAKRVIVHGGVRPGDPAPLTDTWGWDGTRWQLLSMEGPRVAFGAAASALDSGIVMFGGHRYFGQDNVGWHWTGSRWQPLRSFGPLARNFPALATDPRSRRIYLFGGQARGGDPRDLWFLDATYRWSQVYESAP